jgi:hypothetical protein
MHPVVMVAIHLLVVFQPQVVVAVVVNQIPYL